MAHEIFGKRFYSFRVPAWHKLGTVSTELLPAAEIVAEMNIDFQVWDYVLVPENRQTSAEYIETEKRAIVRISPEGKEVIGFVDKLFQIIPPLQVAEIWDWVTGWYPETLFFTRDRMVITADHGRVDLLGEEWNQYTVLSFPYRSGQSIQMHVAPVRVVCMNTYRSSKLQSRMDNRILHFNLTLEKFTNFLGSWVGRMQDLWTYFEGSIQKMAEKPLSMSEWDELTRNFFQTLLPKSDHARRIEEIGKMREVGTAVNPSSVKGWLDAVTEYYDWANLHKDNTQSMLFGSRAAAKELAFEMALAMVET